MKKQTRWIAILMIMALIFCASCAKKDGAGEQAVVGEQVESEEKQSTAQTPSKPTEEQPKDQSAEKNDGKTEEPQKQEAEQPSDSMVKRVETNDYSELVRITDDALKETLGYEIYYYGISGLNIEIDGKIVDFRKAITQDPTVLDRLYDQWEQQFGSDYLAYDGGSACYDFGEYRIYKLNAIEWDDATQTNKVRKDLIITTPDISLDEAKEATK
ncbi:MAG: hypothetical protein IJ995_05750 [Clostridia bacterium]|nr:hypothetical protein [Clostridia bacterium]